MSAERWYLKSLEIEEEHGDEHGAASTYGQLGIVACLQSNFQDAGRWLIKSIQAFAKCHDPENAKSIGVLLAALFLLQTHVRFERDTSGTWKVLVEKEPTSGELLGPIVQKLLALPAAGKTP